MDRQIDDRDIFMYARYTRMHTYMYVCIHMHRYSCRYRCRYTPGVPGVSLSLADPSGRWVISGTELSPPVFCSDLLSGCVKPLVVYKMLPHLTTL